MPITAKVLRSAEECERRLGRLQLPHVAPLTDFVQRLREEKGPAFAIPYFDPEDGGVKAEVLFLLEAPGPRAVRAGFVSRDNPDETAKNFLQLNEEAGIDRQRTACWNVVPWYIGTDTKIRAATPRDVVEAAAALNKLLGLLPELRVVAFVGRHAARAQPRVQAQRADVATVTMPHPSPVFVNRRPGNRDLLLTVLRDLASMLGRQS
jgi:uracil-DNA glycosylase